MIDISKIETFGWETAIRGMRNSFASWNKSDSEYEELTQTTSDGRGAQKTGEKRFHLGSNDLDLASRLAWCGGPEAKFRRMIHAQMDILAPLYWWKEFDTYKVGTVANSTSTMHSIMKKEFAIDDFSTNKLSSIHFRTQMLAVIKTLNELREAWLKEEDLHLKKMYWYDVIQLLPESYDQLRTVDLNYEVLSQMVKYRANHKLDEWRQFCRVIQLNLPYANQLIFCGVKDDTPDTDPDFNE